MSQAPTFAPSDPLGSAPLGMMEPRPWSPSWSGSGLSCVLWPPSPSISSLSS